MTPAQVQLAARIGANIAAERKALGMQQGALAERIGVAQATMSKLENGNGVPGVETLLRIADVLGCTLTALLMGVDWQSDVYRQGYDAGWRACAVDVQARLAQGPRNGGAS